MTNFLTIIGIITFVLGGMFRNKIALAIGVGLILFGAFI